MHPPMPSTAPALPPAQPPIKSGTTSKVALSSPPLSKLPSRSSLTRTLAKGKGKMPDATSHSSSCTKCRLAMDASMAILDGSPPPTMSPDCVLFQNSGQMISADKKCFCSKDESPKRTAAYSTLHRLFYNRFRMHDLPIIFHEEVGELERTIPSEMIRDAMISPNLSSLTNANAWADAAAGGLNDSKHASPRKARVKAIKLSEWPDSEAKFEMREELVSLAKVLCKELLFDTTAPVVFEELTYLAETHGYNAAHGPPCVCVLSVCLPCLKNLADRLVPASRPRPSDRVPPDYAFLEYSAKALKAQGLLPEFKNVEWEEHLRAAQERTGDELWRIAMEINLEKVSREYMNSLSHINHERFYKLLYALFSSEYDPTRCSYKPIRDTNKVSDVLALIDEVSATDFESRRERAEREKEKGNVAFGKGRFRRASKHFTQALILDPDFPVYPLNRAAASLKLERFAKAEVDCTTCINLEPRNPKALFRRAMARKGLGALVDAEADLKLVYDLEPRNGTIHTELQAVAEMLQRLAGSSSAAEYVFRTPIPRMVDTAEAQQDRYKSEQYWRERFSASIGPPSHLHRGTSGRPCRAYNQSANGCTKGNSCPDSHMVDANSVRVDGIDRNTCTHHRQGQNRKAMNGKQADDYDDCPYGHPAAMDPETEAALKEIETMLMQDGSLKGGFPLDKLKNAYEGGIFDPFFTGSKLAGTDTMGPMGAAAHVSFGLTDKDRKKLERVMPSKEALADLIKRCGISAGSTSASIATAFTLSSNGTTFSSSPFSD